MNPSLSGPAVSAYRLTSPLSRECLPHSEDNPNRPVEWMIPICLAVLMVGTLMTRGPAELAFVTELDPSPTRFVIETPPPANLPPVTKTITITPETPTEPSREPLPRPAPAVAPNRVLFAVPTPGAMDAGPDLRPFTPPRVVEFRGNPSALPVRPSERRALGDLPWPTDRDYPSSAKSRKESGDVLMVIDVGPDGGFPTAVSIEKTSHSSSLDDHACEWVRTRWKFKATGAAQRYRTLFTYQLGQ